MIIVGIDPGLNSCGVAMYNTETDRWILDTVHGHPKMPLPQRVLNITAGVKHFVHSNTSYVHVLVIERMQVYRGAGAKGDAADLIDLSVLCGTVLGAIYHSACYMPVPAQWKGQVPKPIHHRRIRKEHPGIPQGVSEDAMDAAGLALWGLKKVRA